MDLYKRKGTYVYKKFDDAMLHKRAAEEYGLTAAVTAQNNNITVIVVS